MIRVILATFAFWFIKVENILVIFQSMYQAGRWLHRQSRRNDRGVAV